MWKLLIIIIFSTTLIFVNSVLVCTSVSLTECGTTSAANVITGDIDSSFRYINATGCPAYDWTLDVPQNEVCIQNYQIKLPLIPTLCKNNITLNDGTNSVLGIIGITSSGVAFFSSEDSKGRDALVYEAHSLDSCYGHGDTTLGIYHYHSEPPCLVNKTLTHHSPLLGFMYDGIPIYGPLSTGGLVPTDLDECGGHVDATYPYYHYHMKYNQTEPPYTISCLRGKISNGLYPGASGGLFESPCVAVDSDVLTAFQANYADAVLADGSLNVPPFGSSTYDQTSDAGYTPTPTPTSGKSTTPTPSPTPSSGKSTTPTPSSGESSSGQVTSQGNLLIRENFLIREIFLLMLLLIAKSF